MVKYPLYKDIMILVENYESSIDQTAQKMKYKNSHDNSWS